MEKQFVLAVAPAFLIVMCVSVSGVHADNRGAVERMRLAVDRDYSNRDRLGIDWKKRFDEYQSRLEAATDAAGFAHAAAELLGAAKDIHIWINVGDKTIGTFQRDMRPNFNPRILPKLIPTLKQHGTTVLVVDANVEQFQTADPVLQKALEQLRKQ